MLRYNMQ